LPIKSVWVQGVSNLSHDTFGFASIVNQSIQISSLTKKMTQTPFKKSDISSVEITPTWKWEGDEFLVGISTSLIGEGDHVLYENTALID
jgi:hypothetical protein